MVKPMAAQPRRRASPTDAVTAWSLLVDSEFALLHFRIVGMAPAKVSAPASSMPSVEA